MISGGSGGGVASAPRSCVANAARAGFVIRESGGRACIGASGEAVP